MSEHLDRRRLLRLGLVIAPGVAVAACTGETPAPPAAAPLASAPPTTGTLPATPSCADADDETPPQTAGPYFVPGSPRRADLRDVGVGGTVLTLTGRVVDTACRPIDKALLDFWQADDGGVYDNKGFRLRGHQFTAADGAFRLVTVVPGQYPGRTRHLHVRVQRPNGTPLTTQLYFPGEAANARDGIFDDALLVTDYRAAGTGRTATFTFVLPSR